MLLDYFSRIGVDPSTQVNLVVGTHAHDDHIAGIADVFGAATQAKFVASAAMTGEEFWASIEADADIESALRQTVRAEYRGVLEEVSRRGRGPGGIRSYVRTLEQMPLLVRDETKELFGAKVIALSPSQEAIGRASDILARQRAAPGGVRRLSAGDPNEFAVALWVSAGGIQILLGADLLRGPSGCGWMAVLETHTVETSERGSLVKVPHHGSVGAYHEEAWRYLVDEEAVSIVAPYRPLRTPIPTAADLDRIKRDSSIVYVTAPSSLPKLSTSERKAAAALAGLATNVRTADGKPGQVRARRRQEVATWDVETFGPAREV